MREEFIPIKEMIVYQTQTLPKDIKQTEEGIEIIFDKNDVKNLEELKEKIRICFPPRISIKITLE